MSATATPNGRPTRTGQTPDNDPWAGDQAEAPVGDRRTPPTRRRTTTPEVPPRRTLAERRRRPTGQATHPLLLVSGSDHSGKSYETALLTADPRVGRSYWIEVGQETTADWYGAIPGARYELIEHDGRWWDFLTAVEQVHAEAGQLVAAADYDGRPPLLALDSGSGEWLMLSQWAENRALAARANIEKLAADPNADLDIGTLYWNAANRRHRRLMTLLLTFPGIVVVTARGKMAVAIKDNGQPDTRVPKVYTLEANRSLPYDATMHVRLDREAPPTVVGYRHPTHGIGGKNGTRPVVVDGRSDARFRDVDFSLAWLIFDVMQYDPAAAVVRHVADPTMGEDAEPDAHVAVPVRRVVVADVDGADETPGQPVANETAPGGVGRG